MFLNAVKRILSFKFSCLDCMFSILAHSECDTYYRLWRNQSVKWFVKYTALDILVVSLTRFLPSILIFWQLFCPEYNNQSLVYNSGKFCFKNKTQRPWLILNLRVSERQNHWLCHKGLQMEGKPQKYKNTEKQRQGKALMLRFLICDMHPAATRY